MVCCGDRACRDMPFGDHNALALASPPSSLASDTCLPGTVILSPPTTIENVIESGVHTGYLGVLHRRTLQDCPAKGRTGWNFPICILTPAGQLALCWMVIRCTL